MIGDCFNVIYKSGSLCFQAPAMQIGKGPIYINLVTKAVITPLSVEPMARDRLEVHSSQIADAKRKWRIG